MTVPDQDTLFPTMVIGSLPRPRWVQDVIADRIAGHLSGPRRTGSSMPRSGRRS